MMVNPAAVKGQVVPNDATLAEDVAESTADPSLVLEGLNLAVTTVQTYGWLLLGFAVFVAYVASRLRPSLQKWQQQREDSAYKKQDVNATTSRMEAMMRAREKMQGDLDAKAELYKQKQAEKEEQQRLEKIDDYDKLQQGKSRLKPGSQPSSSNTQTLKKPTAKKSLRDGYSPLMGSDSGGYRPSRRAGPSGGG